MAKNIGLTIFIVAIMFIIVVGIGVGAYIFIGGGNNILDPNAPQRYWYQCDVAIDEFFIFDQANIESVNCVNTQRKCGSLFSLFGTKGKVQFYDNTGKVASKDFNLPWLGIAQTISQDVCTTGNGLNVRLYNDAGNLLDQESA